MPRSITCLLAAREISVAEALDIRESKDANIKSQVKLFTCVECGKPVRPHKDGATGGAHFEHHRRNPDCKLSDVRRQRSAGMTGK